MKTKIIVKLATDIAMTAALLLLMVYELVGHAAHEWIDVVMFALIKYHLVWITKYRKPVITGKIAERTRELIRMVCQSNEVEILAGHCGK